MRITKTEDGQFYTVLGPPSYSEVETTSLFQIISFNVSRIWVREEHRSSVSFSVLLLIFYNYQLIFFKFSIVFYFNYAFIVLDKFTRHFNSVFYNWKVDKCITYHGVNLSSSKKNFQVQSHIKKYKHLRGHSQTTYVRFLGLPEKILKKIFRQL